MDRAALLLILATMMLGLLTFFIILYYMAESLRNKKPLRHHHFRDGSSLRDKSARWLMSIIFYILITIALFSALTAGR